MNDEIEQFIDAVPTAIWWKRLLIIRHWRAVWLTWCLARHYTLWTGMGMIPWDAAKDYAVRDAIWRGEK